MSESAIRQRTHLLELGDLSVASVAAWVRRPRLDGRPASNNHQRDRLSVARSFLTWCAAQGEAVDLPRFELMAKQVRNVTPRLYGKVQDTHPARFLTKQEAERFIAACQDGTWLGSRDQLVIRLGLLGLRVTEIRLLCWEHFDGTTIRKVGKKGRLRTVTPGPVMLDLLSRWRRQYEKQLGRPVEGTDPIICKTMTGKAAGTVAWGKPYRNSDALRELILRRAQAAGLGWIAPHDLKRSCAAILHNTKSADGGHIFDLLDIQNVLDHADPATTQRSYLAMLDTGTKVKAGAALD